MDYCGAGGPGVPSLASVAGEHSLLAGTPLSTLLWACKLCGNCELRLMNGHPAHPPGGVIFASETEWCSGSLAVFCGGNQSQDLTSWMAPRGQQRNLDFATAHRDLRICKSFVSSIFLFNTIKPCITSPVAVAVVPCVPDDCRIDQTLRLSLNQWNMRAKVATHFESQFLRSIGK